MLWCEGSFWHLVLHGCCSHTHTHVCVSESKRYSRQFSSSLLSEQSSSSSHLHMVGIHLMLLHWNCPSSHSVSVPVSVPENDSEENYSRCSSTQTNITCNHYMKGAQYIYYCTKTHDWTELIQTQCGFWPEIILLHAHFNEAMTKKTKKHTQTFIFILSDGYETINSLHVSASSTFNILLVQTRILIKCCVCL